MKSRLGRTVAALAAVAVTGVAVVGGCSSDDDEPSGSKPSASPSEQEDPPVVTTLVVGNVSGRLAASEQEAVSNQVQGIVDTFFDEAYLGDFPRTSFGSAYAAFTKGAKRDARRDKDLLSNAGLSDRIDSAEATARTVSIDIFAPRGRPAGVTAYFTLDLSTTGDLEQAERVEGRLLLDHEGDDWQVFGYSIDRSVVPS